MTTQGAKSPQKLDLVACEADVVAREADVAEYEAFVDALKADVAAREAKVTKCIADCGNEVSGTEAIEVLAALKSSCEKRDAAVEVLTAAVKVMEEAVKALEAARKALEANFKAACEAARKAIEAAKTNEACLTARKAIARKAIARIADFSDEVALEKARAEAAEAVKIAKDALISELYGACRTGDIDTVKRLFDKLVEMKDVFEVKMDDVCNEYKSTALMTACDKGFYEIVELLLEKGASLDIQNKGGMTALHFAGQCRKKAGQCYHLAEPCCHSEIVKLLLKQGAKCNIRDDKNQLPQLCMR
jgi:hypothetical protein